MPSDAERPYVDALSLNAEDTRVYEAVAALEYQGRPATKAEIAATAGLDSAALEQVLDRLTGSKALLRQGTGGGAVYEPASREWSITPPRTG